MTRLDIGPASGNGGGFFVVCGLPFESPAESAYLALMPDGVGPGKGWDIFVNGTYRVFHDVRTTAIGIAHNLQERNKGSLIEIQDNSTGGREKLLPDGRLVGQGG